MMENKEKEVDFDTKTRTMAFFSLFYPSLLVGIVGLIDISKLYAMVIILLMLLYQAIMLNNFVSKYYGAE